MREGAELGIKQGSKGALDDAVKVADELDQKTKNQASQIFGEKSIEKHNLEGVVDSFDGA